MSLPSSLAPVRTVSFEARPCTCVNRHVPKVEHVELHHVYPQAEQLAVYGYLVNPAKEPLCPTSHRAVHRYIDAHYANHELPNLNPKVVAIAKLGIRLIEEGRAKSRENNELKPATN